MQTEKTNNDFAATSGDTHQLKRTLNEISSSRQLEKIVNSIARFLNSQILRIEEAIRQCSEAADNDRIVQAMLADFERKKQAWEETRNAEIERLNQAGEDLIQGWQKLEQERQQWIDQRKNGNLSENRS